MSAEVEKGASEPGASAPSDSAEAERAAEVEEEEGVTHGV
jgi:hypothetical protein